MYLSCHISVSIQEVLNSSTKATQINVHSNLDNKICIIFQTIPNPCILIYTCQNMINNYFDSDYQMPKI